METKVFHPTGVLGMFLSGRKCESPSRGQGMLRQEGDRGFAMTDCGVSVQHHEETQGPPGAGKELVPGQSGDIGHWERGELRGRIWPPPTCNSGIDWEETQGQ